ncbi:MAG: hypothetical protein KGH94_04495 [Candidatus Micrarchaeota archaeon]|nr:hypothetical protein [Candidatus Micrarchaeota archaeon]
MRQIFAILLLLMAAAPALALAGTSGPSPIPNPPSFQISTNTLTLCKGIVNYVPVTVTNLGKFNGSITMESVQLGVTGRSIVAIANGTTTLLTVPPNRSQTAMIPVFVNLNGSSLVSAGVTISYNYLNYYSDSEIRNVSFGTMICPSQLSVSISPTVLTSGKIENATLILRNNGTTSLNDVSLKMSLSPTDGQVLTQQPILIDSIPPMGTARVNENLFINSSSQTFPVNVSASLYNGTKLMQIADSLTVLSSGIINLTPSGITVSPTTPTPDSIFSISFVLTDLGTSSASAVTATVIPPPGLDVFGSNSVFVGSMQVDSQTPVTLTLSATSRTGNYTVPIRVTYLNNLRQEKNITIDVPVSVGGSFLSSNSSSGRGNLVVTGPNGTQVYRKSSGGGLIILILGVLVVVLAALYWRERGRNRKEARR